MSSKNIINTLIDSNNINNIPDNINNNIVDELVQQGIYDSRKENLNYQSISLIESSNQINYQQQESAEQNPDSMVLNYTTDNILYSMAFQNSQTCRLAVGTLEKNLNNKIEILEINDNGINFINKEDHEFPSTKLMWSPNSTSNNILASSSDVVRLYHYSEEDQNLILNTTLNNKKSKYCSPLTSFDWNRENNSILGTASIDTTCTIWDLNKNTIRTQLIAHDKEVFDIAFSQHENVFISTGADGSIRLFDLRSLDHSTIIFEQKNGAPITKIAWNIQNNSYVSALGFENDVTYIIDTRMAMASLLELKSHTAPVTSMAWAPQSAPHICTVGSDGYVLIWNIHFQLERLTNGPALSYQAPSEISNVTWSNIQPEWIAIAFKNQLQLLKV
jgi:WD repeat-containing protein 68